MKVVICDLYDGFDIVIYEDDEVVQWWNFDQEDTRERMVAVFQALGIEAEYEESYLKENMKCKNKNKQTFS